jgi:hypothetical protein
MVWLEGPHEPAGGGAPGARGSRGRSHVGANGPASEEVAGGSETAARTEPARTRCARAAGARRAAGRRAREARAPRAAEGARIDVISTEGARRARTAGETSGARVSTTRARARSACDGERERGARFGGRDGGSLCACVCRSCVSCRHYTETTWKADVSSTLLPQSDRELT